MVVSAIAYDTLKKENPSALAKVLDILRQHPQYKDTWADRLQAVPEDGRDRYLFMIAARWPDDIRKQFAYDHPKWHYIDYPYVPTDADGKVTPPKLDDENALTELQGQEDALRKSDNAATKAIAACWVMHLVGDLHQPLHCVTMYTAELPEGDRGGNELYVKAGPRGGTLNLHSLWDGLILGAERYTDAKNVAAELENRSEFAKDKLIELKSTDPQVWAKESFELAVKDAYLDGKLPRKADRHDPAQVPADYLRNAKAAAERRMMLAGYRLASALAAD